MTHQNSILRDFAEQGDAKAFPKSRRVNVALGSQSPMATNYRAAFVVIFCGKLAHTAVSVCVLMRQAGFFAPPLKFSSIAVRVSM